MDTLSYRNNIHNFIDKIRNSFVYRINYDIDDNPTFDKKTIPFDFTYCNSIRITTDKEHFDIITSMTERGVETFWITTSSEIKNFTRHLEVNSKVRKIEIKNGLGSYASKMILEFEKCKLFIYSGEVYEKSGGSFDYVINDEMILVFDNEKYAEIFETMVYGHTI